MHSSQTSQTTLLDLGKGPASAQKCDKSNHTGRGQRLEQVPACVVKEEDTLHGENRAVEECMRHGRGTKRLAKVARVGTQSCPYAQKHGKRSSYRCGEDNRNGLGRRFGVVAEHVVDLGFGSVAQRCLGDSKRDVRIVGHGEVKDLVLVGCRGTK